MLFLMLHPTSNSHVLSTYLVAELVAETQLTPHIFHIWVSSPSSVPSQCQAFPVLAFTAWYCIYVPSVPDCHESESSESRGLCLYF